MRVHPSILLGASAVCIVSPAIFTHPVLALTGPEINRIAQQTSVFISVQKRDRNSRGSGFTASSNNGKYYVVTNKHVTEGWQEVSVRMHDGEYYVATNVTEFANTDLAVIEFESSRSYPVVKMAPTVEVGQDVFVSGWPPATLGSDGTIVRQFIYGRVSADLESTVLGNGYQVAYSAPTEPGMSGGQVLDASGRVVAIHGLGGLSEPEYIASRTDRSVDDPIVSNLVSTSKTGLNYGIPVSTFLSQSAANGIYLNFDVSSEPVQALGTPVANASDAAPNAAPDRIEDINAGLDVLNSTFDTIQRGQNVICGFLGC